MTAPAKDPVIDRKIIQFLDGSRSLGRPMALKAGFCSGKGFFGAPLELLPAVVDDVPELAPAALSAAGVLALSDMIVMDLWSSACAHEDGLQSFLRV